MTDRSSPRPRVAMTMEQCWHEVPGGTARAAVDLAAELVRRDNVLLTGISARHSAPAASEYVPPMEVRQAKVGRLALYEGWHHLRRPRVEAIAGPVDVVHATGIAFPPSAAPVVSTLHDLAFLRMPEHYTRRGNSFFNTALRLTRRHAALVSCSSMQTLRDCEDAGIPGDRLRHVPLGVRSATVTQQDRERVRRRHGLERPFILWTGTREPRKNLARLIEAYRSLPTDDLDLVLVGPSGWHEDQTGLSGSLPSGVRTLGFLPTEELTALYAECTVFCFPSLFEGFGLPVVEAMRQGAPVITSRGTSTEEIVGEDGLLVDPTAVEEIAEALSRIIADADLRRTLGAAGKTRSQQYTWENTAIATEALYREVLSS